MGIGLISAPIDWLTQPATAMIALIISNVWIGIPFNMILISTGLTTIPTELYESAGIDGANKLQTFWKISAHAEAYHRFGADPGLYLHL